MINIIFLGLMIFGLTWQHIYFLRKDYKRLEDKYYKIENEITDIKYKK